ncbi:Cytochrome c [Candidatus Magnetomoraceae bacterium gMMP-1]
MTSKNDKLLAYGIAAVLLFVGVVGYAAFPEKVPDEPYRILFKSMAGKVQFDHKMHAEEDGYGIECNTCHHNLEEGEREPEGCGECHESDSEDPMKRSEAFHEQCIGCHEDSGPTDCKGCHLL